MPPLQDHDGPVSLTDATRDGWSDRDVYGEPADTDCAGGDDAVLSNPGGCAPLAVTGRAESPAHTLPVAEARAYGSAVIAPAGVDRSEGKAAPSQPRDALEVGARPLRQGQPCATCPWRVDQHADAIPNFDLELAENLIGTTSDQLGAPLFACHQSRPGREVVCRGWLVAYGWDNIAVRLKLINGSLTPEDLTAGEDWPELHSTFGEVIEKLRADA